MSTTVPIYGFGGGGASMNFTVVGGTSAPSNPRENTIWINTATDITGWYFSAEQPEGIQQGEVWISTGTDSQVAFNALKKGAVMVYPLSAEQMQDGALVDVTAKIYQGAEWLDLLVYIFKHGASDPGSILTEQQTNASVSVSSDGVVITYWGSQGYTFTYAWSEETYDVTDFSTLCFEVDFTDASAVSLGLKADGGKVQETYEFSAYIQLTETGATVVELDISNLSGMHGFAYMGKAKGTIYNVYLKR